MVGCGGGETSCDSGCFGGGSGSVWEVEGRPKGGNLGEAKAKRGVDQGEQVEVGEAEDDTTICWNGIGLWHWDEKPELCER